MNIRAVFVKSAAGLDDFPLDRLPEIAVVGRSNVGKSSLINALTRSRVARTSAAPGKTRLANLYRVIRGANRPLYLVDLPGYGYARGGADAARGFEELARAFFGRARQSGRAGEATAVKRSALPASSALPAPMIAALLLVDARHGGLQADLAAWRWLKPIVDGEVEIVATKVDKLARGQRIRAMRELESVFHQPVLPISAVTGEGMEELWKAIDKLANSRSSPPRSRRRPGEAMERLNPNH